jgi:hypothetical protein
MEWTDLSIMDSDSLGFALSLDLLLALIPITLMLGMVAADMDNIMFQMQDTIFRGSSERVAADTANTLLTTSGQPVDWETTGNPIVPGLAQYDTNTGLPIEGLISSTKLAALNNLSGMIGPGYGYNMTISYILANGQNGASIKSLGTTPTGQDIVRDERIARYARLNIVSEIEGQIRGSGASKIYTNPPNSFTTNYFYNQTYQYWIVVNNTGYAASNVTVSINTNTINFTNLASPKQIDPTFLNFNQTIPNQLYNNTVKVTATGTPGSWMNLYIVQVPRNPPVSQNDINLANTQPQPCRLELYLWTTTT